MDHVGGLIDFLYQSRDRRLLITGPIGTAARISHTILSYEWNLIEVSSAFTVVEIGDEKATGYDVKFPSGHVLPSQFSDLPLRCAVLDHAGVDSIAYRVEERVRYTYNADKGSTQGLKPGPWIREEKDKLLDGTGSDYQDLFEKDEGRSIAYLTDFGFSSHNADKICEAFGSTDIVLCEASYLSRDEDTAELHGHLTAPNAAVIANLLNAKDLIIGHFSRRYTDADLNLLQAEASAIFEGDVHVDLSSFE